ncbi:MAG: ornithine carbamoyltransferase [Oscillospiraceae bacterium]|nr:ornithine carbamoyltransferase [Oscillospiraceae bacterium]
MKHLLKLGDLSTAEITEILDLADKLKAERKAGIPHRLLEGQTLGMIFTKSSTRTRVSFEVGIHDLGGHAMFLSSRDIQLGRGESIKDTARVLSRYLDGIMIRTFDQKDPEDLAKYGSIPIINGLTDYCHPCQVLADLQTMREFKGNLEGRKLTFVGDGNNMANSLIVGCIKMGMYVSVACPEGYRPDADICAWGFETGRLEITDDIFAAAKDADAIYTDVWASMGQEEEAEKRKKVFAGYCVDSRLMSVAKPDAMVLHCLPAHKGEEIMEDVFEAHANEIFEEAENRLHAQKAVMVLTMKK